MFTSVRLLLNDPYSQKTRFCLHAELGDADMEHSSSLDALLDEIEHLSGRQDDQRSLPAGSDVHLNIYNMIGLNNYISYLGLGAFHTGVEVYGVEYAYGGHPYSYTGVYSMQPKQEGSISAEGSIQFKESLHIGFTSLSEREVLELVNGLGREYNGNLYNVFHKNCNHFSGDLCQKLCGKTIPTWVNRLAYLSSWMPFIINCLPPSWVTPGNPPAEQAAGHTAGATAAAAAAAATGPTPGLLNSLNPNMLGSVSPSNHTPPAQPSDGDS